MAGWPRRRPVVPIALAILAELTPEIPGSGEMPAVRPPQFYVVSRAGGGLLNVKQDSPRVLVECWALDGDAAERMALAVSSAFRNARGRTFAGAFIYGWGNEQGPTDFNDPDIQDRRRSQLFGDLLISTE